MTYGAVTELQEKLGVIEREEKSGLSWYVSAEVQHGSRNLSNRKHGKFKTEI